MPAARAAFRRSIEILEHAPDADPGQLPRVLNNYGLFLTRLGLFQRTDRLAFAQPPIQALALIEAARRLTEPDQMGRLFKALALCSPSLPTPPGFAA